MILKKYKFELILFAAAILGSAGIYIAMQHFHPGYYSQDSDWEFLVIAQNLRDHGAYADNDGGVALHPVSGYMPLYAFLIIPFVGHKVLVFVFNWILHALLVVGVYRLSLHLGARRRIAFALSLLFALEPYHLLLTNEVQAEMVLGPLFLWFVYEMIRYIELGLFKRLGLAAAALGLSILARPSAEFLFPFLIIAPVAVMGFSRRAAFHAGLALAIVVAILSPLLVRNYLQFGVASLSSLGTQQMFNAVMPQYNEWREKGTAATQENIEARRAVQMNEANSYIGYDISQRMAIDLREARILNERMVGPFLKEHALGLMGFYATQLPFQMMTDNWRSALDIVVQLPREKTTSLSASIAAVHGDFSQLWASLAHVDLYLVAFVAGKAYWLFFYLLASVGAVVVWRRGGNWRLVSLGLVLLILYFPFVSLPYLESRYRFPSASLVVVLAAVGASALVARAWPGRRHEPRP
jgi:hypothetical protein